MNRRFQFGIILIVFVGVLAITYSLKKNSEPLSSNGGEGLSVLAVSHLDQAPSASEPNVAVSESAVPTNEHDQELISALNQILISKNDNDPRLDTLFKNMSAGTKYLLRQKYQSLPLESRNERGTIVFLLGRDLLNTGDAQDFAFLSKVATEPRCLSLSDCKQETKAGPEDSHEESSIGVTLNYPQHVLMHSIQNLLENSTETPSRASSKQALQILDELSHSSVPPISSQAKRLQEKYGRP